LLSIEYQKAQDSAQHHDTLAWSSFGVCIAVNLALLGFVKDFLQHRELLSLLCVFAIALTIATLKIMFMFNDIKRQKYARCKELEPLLGFRQHSYLQYQGRTQRIMVTVIFVILSLIWVFLLHYVNCLRPCN
jgi:hypothetical protein